MTTTPQAYTVLRASCPCGSSFDVRVGRKSTARVATCACCGEVYDYSAWKLATPNTVGGHTFYKIEASPRSRS